MARLFDKDNLDFVLDDVDALKLVAFNAIDNDALGKFLFSLSRIKHSTGILTLIQLS